MNGETKFKLVYHIYRYGPRSVSELAKYMGTSRQKIHYNLTQLEKEGVVFKKGDKYHLQPALTTDDADLFLKLIYLMTDFAGYLYLPDDVNEEVAIKKNFEYFILLNLGDLTNILDSKRIKNKDIDVEDE